MIKLSNVSFKYPNSSKRSLDNVSLTINKGEFVVLTGPSGSGKSTVTRVINDLIPHLYEGVLEGDIEVAGLDTKTHEPHEFFSTIGSVFQDPRSQFFSFDVDSEIVFGMENMGMERDEMLRRFNKTVSALDLEELRKKRLFDLSGGQKQRVAFASVRVMDPDIYVLDEPSSNLDEETTKLLHDYLKEIKERGSTVVISEHRIHYLADLLDRLIIMNNGKITEDINSDMLHAMSREEYEDLAIRSLNETKLTRPYLTRLPRTSLISSSDDGNVLELRKLSIGYTEGHPVTKDISFAVKGGEVVGITGKNGCGKSTLAKTICGLQKKLSGAIKYKGGRPYMVMQDADYQLYCDSIEEELRRTDMGKDPELHLSVMEKLGLKSYAQAHPLSLSGGQKQRVAIGVASLMNAEVLVFDEPTSGLDYGNMEKVTCLIRELAEKGKAILVISHDNEFIEKACDYIFAI